MVRRINIFGGPGVGKSTMAANIYSALKRDGKKVELVREKIKNWAREGVQPEGFDQCYLFAKQLRAEERILKTDEDITIVTDCPLNLVVFYTQHYGYEYWEELQSLSDKFNQQYNSVDLFIEREFNYKDQGRYQSEEEAEAIDQELKDFLLPTESMIVGDFESVKESVHNYI